MISVTSGRGCGRSLVGRDKNGRRLRSVGVSACCLPRGGERAHRPYSTVPPSTAGPAPVHRQSPPITANHRQSPPVTASHRRSPPITAVHHLSSCMCASVAQLIPGMFPRQGTMHRRAAAASTAHFFAAGVCGAQHGPGRMSDEEAGPIHSWTAEFVADQSVGRLRISHSPQSQSPEKS